MSSTEQTKSEPLPDMTGSGILLKDRSLAALFVFFGLGFLVFANTFGNGWTYDDFPVIVENTDVRSWFSFLQDSYPGRPLREMTYLVDYKLFGLEPRGWHFQNIFWHGFNAWLLFLLVAGLAVSRSLAWLTALIFLLHPLQVEVVANISHRKDSLALACVLLAVLAYQKALAGEKNKLKWLCLTAVAWGAGLLAKQVAAMLPLFLVSYEFFLVPAERRLLCRNRRWLVGAVVLVLFSAGGWLFFGEGSALFSEAIAVNLKKYNVFSDTNTLGYYLTVLAYQGRMVLRIFWPVDLAAEYTFPASASVTDPWALLGGAALLAAGAGIVLARKRNPPLAFALLWILVFWLPVSNLWPLVYLAADRYWYLPMAGISLSLAFALNYLCSGKKDVLFAAALVVCCLMSWLTWQQNKVWASPGTLWAQAVAVSPTSPFALNNMGNVHLLEGDSERALSYYLLAKETNPYNPTAYYNLGLIYEKRMKLRQAREAFLMFLERAGENYSQDKEKVRKHLQHKYGWTPSPGQG